MSSSIYDFKVMDIEGNEFLMSKLQGKTLLIVNVASKCGFTNQYTDLEKLYRDYSEKGLVVLGFPCNQFGAQEPGNENEIKKFCGLNYDVTFPLFAKIDVNGEHASPLYEYLKNSLPGILGTKAVKWNFTKFLVNKSGLPVARFAPNDKPNDILSEIQKIL